METGESKIQGSESLEGEKNEVHSEPLTLYSPEGMKEVKREVKRSWDRVKKNKKNLNQSGLAIAIGISQGAVSKLLGDQDGHPWTERHLRSFSSYTNIPIREFVPEELMGFFNGWEENMPDLDKSFLSECSEAVKNFYSHRGKHIESGILSVLAGKLCAKLEGTKPSDIEMDEALLQVIIEQAAE